MSRTNQTISIQTDNTADWPGPGEIHSATLVDVELWHMGLLRAPKPLRTIDFDGPSLVARLGRRICRHFASGDTEWALRCVKLGSFRRCIIPLYNLTRWLAPDRRIQTGKLNGNLFMEEAHLSESCLRLNGATGAESKPRPLPHAKLF